MRAVWAAARIGAPLVIACACSPRSLDSGGDGGSGAGSVSAPNQIGPGPSSGDRGAGVGGGMGIGGPHPASCPAVEQTSFTATSVDRATRVPTSPPFSCQPLPAAYIFPRPEADTQGKFSRCASFEVGAIKQLAVSPNGLLVALVPADGIVRIVEVATRQVVGVLAPARATIDFLTFSPDGRAVLTLASGEREVTLWSAGSLFARTWTVRLPGHRNQLRWGGGVAFAPDGRSAVVSPGDDTFLLDVAWGEVRAIRPAHGALLDVAYGWGGRRIVVAEGSITSHCAPTEKGGSVTILDAATLADLAQIADLGSYFDPRGFGTPAFGASPTEDLVLVVPSVGDSPGVRAFALSDGTALPAPGLDALPLAFTPDGTHLLLRANGRLSVAERAGGAIVASTADDGSGPVAVSSNGRTVASGGSGQNLLRVWNVAEAEPAAVCSADDPGAPPYYKAPGVSLTADGQVIALGTGSRVRLVRTATGYSPISVAVEDPSQVAQVKLSPNLRFLAAGPELLNGFSTIVFSLLDGGRVAALPADGWWWEWLVFSPREDKLYAAGYREDDSQLYAASLDAPGLTPSQTIPRYTKLLGFSQGCPVLYEASRGAWRSCGTCTDPPVAGPGDAGASSALLSPDGRLLAVLAPYPGSDLTVWPMQPGAAALRTFGPSPEDSDAFQPLQEFPIAIASRGGRVATSTIPAYSCYHGPGLEVRIHDLATGAVIDTLPPTPGYAGDGIAVDRDVRTFAYGAQLWCSDF